nr:type II toxin-antitoxin system HicB family antitoxin [Fusobacterium nucleatum]
MLIYSAIFHKAIEGGYIAVFPDLDDGATEGQTLEQAMENVKVLLLERM